MYLKTNTSIERHLQEPIDQSIQKTNTSIQTPVKEYNDQ